MKTQQSSKGTKTIILCAILSVLAALMSVKAQVNVSSITNSALNENVDEKLASLEKQIMVMETKIGEDASFDRYVKVSSMLGALLVFCYGVVKYISNQKQEFLKVFWERRYDLYSRATKAASRIAVASDLDSVKEERTEFWSLYWGELSIIETQEVFTAMVSYGVKLQALEHPDSVQSVEEAKGKTGVKNRGQTKDLKQLSYDLATACRNSLDDTWRPTTLHDLVWPG